MIYSLFRTFTTVYFMNLRILLRYDNNLYPADDLQMPDSGPSVIVESFRLDEFDIVLYPKLRFSNRHW